MVGWTATVCAATLTCILILTLCETWLLDAAFPFPWQKVKGMRWGRWHVSLEAAWCFWTSWADGVSTCSTYIPALGCMSRRGVETCLVLHFAFLSRDWARSHCCNKPGNATTHTHTHAHAHLVHFLNFEHVFMVMFSVAMNTVIQHFLFYLICRTAPPYIIHLYSIYIPAGLGLRFQSRTDFSYCLTVLMRS